MTLRWRGHSLERDVQVVNALDVTVALSPVSEVPALTVRANWSVLLPGQTIPLIGERRYGGQEELLD